MKEKETTNAMSCPTKSPEASARWKMILSCVVFLVLMAAITILMIPVMRLMMQEGGKEQLIAKIQSYGIFAPLLFVLLQVIQIVVAFIPGGPIPMIGGAVFGMVPGILLSLAGSFLGTAIVYYLVQWIGRPILNLFVKEEHLERFSFLTNRRKMERIVFLLFLCPGLPKDALTYIVAFNQTIPPPAVVFPDNDCPISGDGIDGEDGQQLMGRQLEDDSVGRWHSDFDCSGWRLDSLVS